MIFRFFLFILLISLFNIFAEAQPLRKPNIVFIMADDLGYGDLGAYNPESKVPTPHLDRLAAEGVRFTDAYCPVAVCSPTRYSLMTGRYSWRSWKKTGVMANYEPSMIEDGRLTLPQMLQQAGYETAGFGKWHLGTTFPTTDGQQPVGYGKFRDDRNGANIAVRGSVSDGPLDHGFEHWLGFSCASECWILENNQIMGAIKHDLYTIEAATDTEHLQQIPLADYLPFITERSIRFIQKQTVKSDNRPFFLYFAPYVPHIPLAVSAEFLGKTSAGVYGDYVHELDHYVGQLLATLEQAGLLDNTLILFASDNGSQFVATSPADDPEKVSNSPEDVAKNIAPDTHRPNFPLRGTKWTAYEGGVRTPLIARWPGHFPKGKTSQQLIALTDILPTLAALLGQPIPSNAAEDGLNLLPAFYGKKMKKTGREAVVVQSSAGVFGLRWGKWKYIGGGTYKPKENAPEGELYDLSKDPSESRNLWAQKPEIAAKIKDKLAELLR